MKELNEENEKLINAQNEERDKLRDHIVSVLDRYCANVKESEKLSTEEAVRLLKAYPEKKSASFFGFMCCGKRR